MTAPYLGNTGVVRTPRRIICFKASCAARFRAASVPYAWRSVCFVRPTTSGCLVRARPAWVRLPTLKEASALRKRAVGGIRYATLLRYPDGHVPDDHELMPPTGIRSGKSHAPQIANQVLSLDWPESRHYATSLMVNSMPSITGKGSVLVGHETKPTPRAPLPIAHDNLQALWRWHIRR